MIPVLSRPTRSRLWLRAIAIAVACFATAHAEVTRVEITERAPLLANAPFGRVGAYERVSGKVHFALDPSAEANTAIRDLDLAETSAGKVTFSADFYVLRPIDPANGNGTLLLEISNRGGKGTISRFCLAPGGRPLTQREDFGDAWLFEQGYTLGWVGWQWDVPGQGLRLYPAKLRDAHAPGLVRAEFIPDADASKMPLGDRQHQPIPLAEALSLGMRTHPDEPATLVPRKTWRLVDDGRAVEIDGGFKAGLLYEFIYRGKQGVVAGLGLAAVRDFVAYAKTPAAATSIGHAERAIGFGISQSGRFLRHFLYEGFNADEKRQRVFDGVWADVAGAGRGSFNHRYAQASRDGNPWTNVFYPTDVFPFHDEETENPFGGGRDALLRAARQTAAVPKIFYTNTSYEYWGRVAALVHAAPDGKSDVPLVRDTRVYLVTGAQHGPTMGTLPPTQRPGRPIALPNDFRVLQRGLLHALQAWVKDGTEPPASAYPRVSDGSLVAYDRVQLPKVKGIELPRYPRKARVLDFGPNFESNGVMTAERLQIRGVFPLLVPALDADGVDQGGIKMPVVAVPLGSSFGWNFRSGNAPEHMANFLGSFIPFAATTDQAKAAGDSRRSLAERYPSRADYLERAAAAADALIRARYLLPQDKEIALTQCAQLWDYLAQPENKTAGSN